MEVCGNGWAHKITTDLWADVGHAPSRTRHAVLGFAVHACTHRVEWQHLPVPGYPKGPVGTVDTINFTAYRILGSKSDLQNLDRDQELPLGIPGLADMKSAKPGPWTERTARQPPSRQLARQRTKELQGSKGRPKLPVNVYVRDLIPESTAQYEPIGRQTLKPRGDR